MRTEQNAWFQTRRDTLRVTTSSIGSMLSCLRSNYTVFVEVMVFQNVGRDSLGGCRDVKELYKI
jgi:hypothetical protein